MPSRLSNFKPFARLRERAKAAKATDRERAPAFADAGLTQETAPSVSLDQPLPPQQPHVAVTTGNACPAPADNTIVKVGVDVDGIADDVIVDTSQRAQSGSSHATPPSLHALPESMLETLPAELRLQVLSYISDLRDLRALVLASPVFGQHYRLNRKHVLGQVLLRTLGSLMVEAYAVQSSVTLYDRSPRPLPGDTMRQFIHSYVSRRSAPPELVLEDCTLADLVEMAAFYQSVVRPLSLKCARLFLQCLDPSLDVGSLSGIEKTRLLRALYRFQLYCNLFGQGPEPGRFRPLAGLALAEILALFFGSFHPWEVEEIDCIYTLVRNKYDAVFDAVERYLVSPRLDKSDRPRTPPGFWDSNPNNTARQSLTEGTALRGLRLFFKILATHQHDELVETMQRYHVRAGRFESVLGYVSQDMRRLVYPLEGDLAEDRREKLTFSSDTEDGPPLAWVIGWRGRYVNRYGPAIPAPLKAWGHVIWDRRRLIESKGKDVVLRARNDYG